MSDNCFLSCDFLEKLSPGDMIMAESGFTIIETVGLTLKCHYDQIFTF